MFWVVPSPGATGAVSLPHESGRVITVKVGPGAEDENGSLFHVLPPHMQQRWRAQRSMQHVVRAGASEASPLRTTHSGLYFIRPALACHQANHVAAGPAVQPPSQAQTCSHTAPFPRPTPTHIHPPPRPRAHPPAPRPPPPSPPRRPPHSTLHTHTQKPPAYQAPVLLSPALQPPTNHQRTLKFWGSENGRVRWPPSTCRAGQTWQVRCPCHITATTGTRKALCIHPSFPSSRNGVGC